MATLVARPPPPAAHRHVARTPTTTTTATQRCTALATVVPGPAQFRGYPCLSTRFHIRPGVTEQHMMRMGAACANPPAPGLLYAVIGRCATPGHYIELEVFEDFGKLIHSIERFADMPGVTETLDSLVSDCEMWIGFLAHLPRKYQPVWTTVYEQQQLSQHQTIASTADKAADRNTFDASYYTVAVPYAPELDPGGPVLLTVAIPHTYQPEPVRYTVGQPVPAPLDECGEVGQPPCGGGQGWQLRSDAGGDVVAIPDVSAALVAAVDLCAALGWPAESYPASKMAAADDGSPAAALPRPLAGGVSDKPRNIVVECASGPRRRCYADVAGVLGGRVPCAGDEVVIRTPAGAKAGTAAPVRIGTVVAVSAWCKRKSVAGVEPPVVLRFATPDDHSRAELLRQRYVDALVETAGSALLAVGGGTLVRVADAWCSLDERSCTVAVVTVEGAWTPALSELRRQVSRRLPRSMHLYVLPQLAASS